MTPMRRTSPTPAPALLLGVVLIAHCLCARAETLSLLDGRCSLELPQGWRAEQSYGDAGAALYPPDPRAWPVEIVIWSAPRGAPQTPRAAAMAHEAAIARLYAYTRSSATEVQRADGTRSLQVIGRIQPPEQGVVTSVFEASAGSGYYCVVGTFCLPDQVERVLAGSLAPVAGSVRISPQPGTAAAFTSPPPVPTPLEGNGDTATTGGPSTLVIPTPPPGGVAQPAVGPVTPVVTPQADTGPSTPPASPTAGLIPLAAQGIRLDAPLDYAIEAAGEWWLVRPRGAGRHCAGLLVWPLVVEDTGWSPALIAEEALRRWPASAGLSFHTEPLAAGSGAVFASTEQSAVSNLHIIGTCTTAGDSALVTALYVAGDLARSAGPMLVEMLASLALEPIPFESALDENQTEQWEVPKHPEVSVAIPKGWRARGGITRRLGYWAISFEAIDPGPERRYVSWQQPIVPLFRELTTLLEGIGYKEFGQYTSDAGGETYTLYRRPTPQSFLLDYWNKNTRLSLEDAQIVKQTQPPELSGLIAADGADTLLATVRGGSMLGARENLYALAVGRAEQTGIHNWQAAVLEAGGPAGDTRAIEALRTMLSSVQIGGDGTELDDGFRALVEGARSAATLLPAAQTATDSGVRSVLPLSSGSGQHRWEPPPAAGWWRSATLGGGPPHRALAPLFGATP